MRPAASSAIRVVFAPSGDQPRREINVIAHTRRTSTNVLVVPGRHVTARVLPVAGSTPAQRRAAALAAMAPYLAEPVENCVAAISPITDGKALVCVASKPALEEWRRMADGVNLGSALIVPDLALLPPPAEGQAVIATRDAEMLVRTPAFACAAPASLLPALTADHATTEIDYDAAVRHALAHADLLNFCCFPTTSAPPPARPGYWKRVGALAAAGAVLAIAAPWVSAFRADAAASALRRDASATAAAALPNASRIIDPHAQLAAALAPWRRDASLFSLTVSTLNTVAATSGARLERLEADADEGVSARIILATPADLDALRTRITHDGYLLQETPAGTSPDGRPAYSLSIRNAS